MNDNQKGTALTGGALTDEVMESSDSVLTPGMFGQGQKGLQQFYAPPQAASLIAQIIGQDVSVLDPTAGDGSLLSGFNPTKAFGIEIDADQIKNSEGRYNALAGDFQRFYNLIRSAMSPWPAIVANPPFGLQWEHPAIRGGKPTNSTVFTFLALQNILDEDGQFVFICGASRFDRQIAQLPDAEAGIYAVIECDDLFEGTREPCVIAFGLHPANRATGQSGVLERRTLPRDMLDMAGTWVLGHRTTALGNYNRVSTRDHLSYRRVEEFKSVQEEYNRRVLAKIKTREFDAQLYNGDHIQWLPSPYAKLSLQQAGKLYDFNGLNGQPVAYFAQNERVWYQLQDAEEREQITLDPKLRMAVAGILGDIQKVRIPLYALKPTQRIGFLDDIDSLLCVKDDKERRFKAGERYDLNTSTKGIVIKEERLVESKKNAGEYEQKTFEKHRKVMHIQLSGHGAHYSLYDGGERSSQDIAWLISHFEIPDKGDISTVYPAEIEAMEKLVREVLDEFQVNSAKWEEKNPTSMPFRVRDFQVRDIARLLFKGFGMLAWEQGLGKTVGGLAFFRAATKLDAKKKCLVVTAADLIPQWTREAERFMGKTPEIVKTHGQAKKIARDLRRGGTGFYITNYEALAINGTLRKNKQLPVVTVKEWTKDELVRGTDRHTYWCWAKGEEEFYPGDTLYQETLGDDWREECEMYRHHPVEAMVAAGFVQKPSRGYRTRKGTTCDYGYVQARFEKKLYKLTSKDICPECHTDTKNGWNGLYCEGEDDAGQKCGYSHFAVRMKPIAALLSTAFHDGVAIMDEITYIQGDTSKRSIALRGIQARYRLGMTGTPIKNYVDQVFWPLAWCLGYGKTWFPYEYGPGKTRFQGDFCVVEYMVAGRRKENRKVLPEVTNLSRFWRMLASCTIRRRAEETGEDLVDIYYHDISVPFSVGQAEQTREWLKKLPHGFPAFFAEKYPDSKVVKAGMHEMMAPLLGLNWKLDYACTLPKADPDHKWTGIELSNWTPANLRTLELALALAKQGRKVLVGSHIVAEGQWLAERLQEKGVKAVHIVDESGTTVNAKQRAKHVYSFQTDPDVQVFCAGMKAIRLGHNLDAANAVVLNGLDFDYETLDQFIKRVRRLTSKEAVDVFVILPTLEGQQTITTRKWELLGMKGNAADLALDGRLIEKAEQEIGETEMIRQLQERGFQVTDEALDEADVKRAWELLPALDDFELMDGMIPPRPEKVEDEEPDVPEVVDDQLVLEANAAEMAEHEPEVDDSFLDEEIKEGWEAEGVYDADEGWIDPALVREAEEAMAAYENVADATNSGDLVPTPDSTKLEGGEPDVQEGHADSHAGAVHPAAPLPAPDPEVEPPIPSGSDDPSTPDVAPLGVAATEEAPVEEPVAEVPAPSAPALDPIATLKGAKELLDLGVIDADEFAQIRTAQLKVMGVAA